MKQAYVRMSVGRRDKEEALPVRIARGHRDTLLDEVQNAIGFAGAGKDKGLLGEEERLLIQGRRRLHLMIRAPESGWDTRRCKTEWVQMRKWGYAAETKRHGGHTRNNDDKTGSNEEREESQPPQVRANGSIAIHGTIFPFRGRSEEPFTIVLLDE